MLPPNEKLVICFAHVAYRLHQRFSALNTGVYSFAVRDSETLENRVGEAHVLVISGLWQNGLLDRATKLRFIQAIGAGTDQFPHEELAKRSIRLASADCLYEAELRCAVEQAVLPQPGDHQHVGLAHPIF